MTSFSLFTVLPCVYVPLASMKATNTINSYCQDDQHTSSQRPSQVSTLQLETCISAISLPKLYK